MRGMAYSDSSRSVGLVLCALASVLACNDDDSSGGTAAGGDAGAFVPTQSDGGSSSGQSPPGVVANGPQQGLYVTDYAGALFHLSLEDGSELGKYGTEGDGANAYRRPSGIAATKKHLYVADTGNHRLVRLTVASGAGWKTLDLAPTAEPHGVGALLSADEKEEKVVFSDYAGMQFFTAPPDLAGAPAPGAKLQFNTCGVALREGESAGSTGCTSGPALNVVVNPNSGERIYPASAGTGELSRPDGLAYLPDGTLVIADTGNFRVLCAKGPSARNDFGKQGDATDLEFRSVSAIATDARGRIFVADTTRKRVVRVDDCRGANPKVFDTAAISQMTGLAAVGPYEGAAQP